MITKENVRIEDDLTFRLSQSEH